MRLYKIIIAASFFVLMYCGFFIIRSSTSRQQPANLAFELKKQILYNKLLERKMASMQHIIFDVQCKRQLHSLANSKWVYAQIVWFEPNQFTHSFWIDFGKNQGANFHAPVCLGQQIVGVIDKVEDHRSRVRCITDPHFAVSIQSGSIEYNKLLLHELSSYIQALGGKVSIEKTIHNTSSQIKGYTQGLWDPYNNKKFLLKAHIPLFLPEEASHSYNGHIFITNGFDGIFPANFVVGVVIQSEPRENELELILQPTISFHTMTHVFVLQTEEK